VINDFRLIYDNIKINNLFIKEIKLYNDFYYTKYENNMNFIYLCSTDKIENVETFLNEKIIPISRDEMREDTVLVYRYPNLKKLKITLSEDNVLLG
jgi:hypothetical protein